MEKFRKDRDAFMDVRFDEEPVLVDFHRLTEMAKSEKGVSNMQYFMKHWEYKRASAARLLEEELGLLCQQRKEIEQNKQQILEEQRFQDESYYAVKQHVPILDEAYEDEWKRPSKKNGECSHNREPKIDADQDPIKDVKFEEKPVLVDFQRLMELANSNKGQSHLQYLMKHWVYKRADAKKEIDQHIVQKRQQILEEQRIRDGSCDTVKEGKEPILDEGKITLPHDQELKIDAEHGSIAYWKERAMQLEETLYQERKPDAECDMVSFWKQRVMQLEEKLQACLQREEHSEKTERGIRNPPSQIQMDELSGLLLHADFFLHLILQSAPIIIAHQDVDLRYRFVFNHYPTLADEDVIGKKDSEITPGKGIEEMNSVKREVMTTGIPTKREFVFNTPIFGAKTFLTYIEPVFSKTGETLGVNYVATGMTDQVKRREKMADIRLKEAVRDAMESKLEAVKLQEP